MPLTLRRSEGQRIILTVTGELRLGAVIEIVVKEIQGQLVGRPSVRLGIEAPQAVNIVREELLRRDGTPPASPREVGDLPPRGGRLAARRW